MPIYEYICKKCEHEFEELVFGSDSGVVCPECSCKKVTRAMSVFASKVGSSFRPSSGSSCGDCASGNCSSCNCGGH